MYIYRIYNSGVITVEWVKTTSREVWNLIMLNVAASDPL